MTITRRGTAPRIAPPRGVGIKPQGAAKRMGNNGPSSLERAFDMWLSQFPDIPEPVKEYVFHPTRKWRFDRAWLDQKVAVEIEGVTSYGPAIGRHQSADGFVKDCEKYEAALVLGWKVFRIPGQWIAESSRMICRPAVITTLKALLEVD